MEEQLVRKKSERYKSRKKLRNVIGRINSPKIQMSYPMI